MTTPLEVQATGPIVVGSGAAGLTSALRLGDCLVLTKTGLGEGSSRWAQGGIAAPIGRGDSPQSHAADTAAVAGGIHDPAIAALVAAAAEERIEWLVELGAQFDRDPSGTIALGREAGHSTHRIVHAAGDATGSELMRVLRAEVSRRSDIEVLEHAYVIDLLSSPAGVSGVVVEVEGRRIALVAPAVVLATGGIGAVFSRTTNPAEATGDGLAMAIRTGVPIRDPEFVQFHPTAMMSRLDPMPLLTEALRGAGATLVDSAGRRFMVDVHRDAELAPRDVVARAIWSLREHGAGAWLDAGGIEGVNERFPTIAAYATQAGLDAAVDLLPVSPAAHYHMGGIAVDDHGRGVPGLFAVGEAASTGLHGANRLASNSLIEALVLGARVADAVSARRDQLPAHRARIEAPTAAGPFEEVPEAAAVLRTTMWEHVGLVRSHSGLRTALDTFDELEAELDRSLAGRNLLTVARAVARAALARTESRGAHYRSDYPQPDPRWAHSTLWRPRPAPSMELEAALDRGAA